MEAEVIRGKRGFPDDQVRRGRYGGGSDVTLEDLGQHYWTMRGQILENMTSEGHQSY